MVGGEDVGRLGHEVHAAEHDEVGLGPLLREHRQPVRVAAGVGPPHDLVALVVVAEDEDAVAERRPGPRRSARELVGRRRGVPLGERRLEPQHGVNPRWVGAPVGGRCGQPGRPARGCRPWNGYVAGYQAGVPATIPNERPQRRGASAPIACRMTHGATPARRHDPRHARARTSSRTPTAASSTWARPSRCGQRLSQLLPGARGRCRPAPRRWWRRPRRSSGSRSATTSRR